MSTLGNKTTGGFSTISKQSLTGDGGTSYTLQQSVNNENELEVYVNNTRQEPTTAYTAQGTTLTMTGAVNASDSFYVIFQGKAVVSQEGIFGNSSTRFTSDNVTIGGTLGVTGATTLSNTLAVTGNVGLGGANTSSYLQGVVGGKTATIGDGSQASSTLVLKDDDGVFDIATTGGTFRIYDDNVERIRIDANGHVTMPHQSAFGAHGSGTSTLPINVYTHIPVTVERFDQNGDFDTSTKTFTAPVTGRYQLNTGLYLYNYLDNEAGYLYFAIVTSNETYDFPTQSSIFGSDIGTFTLQGSALADMDAGDTAYVHIYQQGGTAQATISHSHTFFNGALIC